MSYKKSFFWSAFGSISWNILPLFLIMIVTRISGIQTSGALSFAMGMANIFWSIGAYAGRTFQVSDIRSIFSLYDYIGLRFVTNICMFVLTLAFILLGGLEANNACLFVLFVAVRALDVFSDSLYAVMQKHNKLYLAGMSMCLKFILGLFTFLFVYIYTQELLISTFIFLCTTFAIFVVFDIYITYRISRQEVMFVNTNKILVNIILLLKNNFNIFVINSILLFIGNASKYFVNLYYQELQGYFSIIIMPLTFVVLAANLLFQPLILKISIAYQEQNMLNINALSKHITMMILIMGLVCLCVVYVFGVPIINLIFSINICMYKFELMLVIVVGIVAAMNMFYFHLLTIMNNLKFIVVINIIALILFLLLNILLTSNFALIGAIFAYLLTVILQFIGYFYHVNTIINSNNKL